MKVKLSKNQWEEIGKKTGWTKEAQLLMDKKSGWDIYDQPPVSFQYFINLDERGSFYADVRNTSGKTVFEIKAGDSLPEGETSIFEDGFMKHKDDLDGLKKYLVELGIMKPNQKLVRGN